MLQALQKNSHMLLEYLFVPMSFFYPTEELHIHQLCITKAQTPGCSALNPASTHHSYLTSASSTILFLNFPL